MKLVLWILLIAGAVYLGVHLYQRSPRMEELSGEAPGGFAEAPDAAEPRGRDLGLTELLRSAAGARCSACFGRGRVRCEECVGNGTVLRERRVRCPACDGEGQLGRSLLGAGDGAACVRCGGTGRVQLFEKTTCSACDGSGARACGACGGTGNAGGGD